MPPKDRIIEPIEATLDEVAEKLMKGAPPKSNKNNRIDGEIDLEGAPPKQLILDIGVEIQRDVDGIEMGVLENGIPFLTQVGLAELAGVHRKRIYDISQEWEEHYDDQVIGKDRISFLKDYLFKKGYTERKLYIESKKDGTVHFAYPDIVCMAVLEYYAFEAKAESEIAIKNYRKLASYGLQKFIYDALNYVPSDKWKYHNDRVSILNNAAPDGYFVIFNEITGMVVDLITAGLTVSDKTIPDGSVGGCWGRYWTANNLNENYGERIEFVHNYPDYYAQAASNPQKPWAYPEEALPVFRKWFRHEYLLSKFPKYILTKANVLLGGKREAERIASLYQSKQIEGQ